MDFISPDILILAALLGLIPAAIAHGKGRNFFAWWVFGALLFIIALPLAILEKSDRQAIESRQLSAGADRKCPYCAELIKREAMVCRFCGRESEAWQLHNGRWWVHRPDGAYWYDEPMNQSVRYEPPSQPTAGR